MPLPLMVFAGLMLTMFLCAVVEYKLRRRYLFSTEENVVEADLKLDEKFLDIVKRTICGLILWGVFSLVWEKFPGTVAFWVLLVASVLWIGVVIGMLARWASKLTQHHLALRKQRKLRRATHIGRHPQHLSLKGSEQRG